jgi:hypothetical protein
MLLRLAHTQNYVMLSPSAEQVARQPAMGREGCVSLCMTPIGQPCTCEPMTWLYFLFVQSVFVFAVFVGRPSPRSACRW